MTGSGSVPPDALVDREDDVPSGMDRHVDDLGVVPGEHVPVVRVGIGRREVPPSTVHQGFLVDVTAGDDVTARAPVYTADVTTADHADRPIGRDSGGTGRASRVVDDRSWRVLGVESAIATRVPEELSRVLETVARTLLPRRSSCPTTLVVRSEHERSDGEGTFRHRRDPQDVGT